MDRVVTRSLLQHPLPYALVLLDPSGDWLDGNRAAQRLFDSSIWSQLQEPLRLARQQVQSNPDRAVRWQQRGDDSEFDCLLTSITDEMGKLCLLTESHYFNFLGMKYHGKNTHRYQ